MSITILSLTFCSSLQGSIIKKNINEEMAVECQNPMLASSVQEKSDGWWISRKDLIHLRVRLVDFRPKNGLAMVVVGEVNSAFLGPLKWWLSETDLKSAMMPLEDSSEYDDEDHDEEENQLADDQELE